MLGVVREVSIHDDHEGARCGFEAMDVGGAETEFAGSRLEDDAGGAVEVLELFGDFEGAVGRGIVYYYDFPGEIARGGDILAYLRSGVMVYAGRLEE